MTIGDEKVRRYEPRMIGIEDRPHEAGMYADLHGHYVLHSAYAELAAELASYKADTQKLRDTIGDSPAAKLLIELDLLRTGKQAAEAQLAELRGRVTKIADRWDSKNELNGELFAQQLYDTLAAADGGCDGG